MKEVLPIGSVVLLKDAIDCLMIIGYLGKGIDEKEKHYMGIPYPTGLSSIKDVKGFNKEDINEIVFEGNKSNVLFQQFIKKINEQGLFDKGA